MFNMNSKPDGSYFSLLCGIKQRINQNWYWNVTNSLGISNHFRFSKEVENLLMWIPATWLDTSVCFETCHWWPATWLKSNALRLTWDLPVKTCELTWDLSLITWDVLETSQSSSSRMRVMNHNWSATKQRLHLQSVAEINRHSVLSGDRIRQCGTSSGSCHKDTDKCL